MSTSIERIRNMALWTAPVDPQPLSGGLSNESFCVTDGGKKYVVRLGEDYRVHHVVRAAEVIASQAAHQAGFAPQLVHSEPGIMVFNFIDGKTYGPEDVQAGLARVTAMACAFHTTMPALVSGKAALFWVFHVIRDYARTIETGNGRLKDQLPGYLALSAQLEKVQVPLPLIFGHNDLLPANFIDDGQKLWLIDYEYAAWSTAMFDLAGIASNARFSPEQDEEMLAVYFGAPPEAALVQSLAAMKCAALLREAMWSMVSELHLKAPGVDYAAYADENLAQLQITLDAYRSRYGHGKV